MKETNKQQYITKQMKEHINKDNADNVGGFNLFGKRFGDYNQDIIMNLIYDDEYNTRKLE